MKLSHLFAGLLCVSAMFTSAASAKVYTSESTGLAITAPEEWTTETGDTLTISSPDEKAHVIMMTVPADDVQSALSQLDVELASVLQGAKVEGDAKQTEINGLPCVHVSGTAHNGDVALEFTLAVVDAGDDCLIVLAFGTPTGLQEHAETAVAIINSIHKPE